MAIKATAAASMAMRTLAGKTTAGDAISSTRDSLPHHALAGGIQHALLDQSFFEAVY